ncbi:hypothetical protein PsorP6_016251 [Peronosclerospora sorghi]|uniref:Uncharacterized protein n=1 Tax=Peronosclerospora sorghi TaxID=230839 RepID=A0ACC0VS48_9STRA|nr:hypothetical protein PsorP6_016251 [Peronosclerospora sorghi]
MHLVKKVTTVPEPTVCRAPSQLRLMGHGPAPAEGSLEAKVRKYLPKDYHRPAPAPQHPRPSRHYLTRSSTSVPNCQATSRSGKSVSRLLAIKLLWRRTLEK